ncbi:MAG: M13 family metallopeptidase [Flectobacillus sp.]|nr:M13 family metallopeptidase [Flectobacillus sp.]
MKLKQLFLASASVVLLSNCGSKHSEEAVRASFLDKAGMDTTASPADDFAQYANGTWLKNTKIPDDQSGWGSFYTLNEENQKKTKAILEELAAKSASEGSAEQKVGDFYASGMDTLAIEKAGINPVLPTLKTIEAIKTPQAYLDYVAADQDNLGGALFSFYVGADDKNSTKNRINFSQGGLGLPEKSYYTSDEPSTKKEREAYLTYNTTLLKLSGVEATLAAKQAQEVLAFEKALSASHKTPVELRDPIKNYHKYAIADLAKVYSMDWASFLQKMKVKTDSVLMGQPEYYTVMGKLLATTPIEVVKNREKINVLNAASPYLTKAFRTARFEFYGKVLNGQQVESERWKKMANQVDSNLGELLGQIWVQKHFTPEAKERMLTLVTNLQKVYRSRIEKLDWMSKETKAKALVKFDKIINKIGYPDKWKNFDDVTINRATYYANVLSANRHATKEMLEKLTKPVDKTEWGMTPPTVNAYANPSFNEIVFPAGILQFPFFDNNADDAINYGGIGGVIGHELTHLFDDQGRQYDADGNLKDWWKEEDAKKFNAKAQMVVNQYNNFTLFGNVHVNGQLTLGENLADLGGITLAYEAFKLTEQGKSNEKIDGFTPDQRFFMSWAQVWRIKDREESMRVRLNTDPHSPEVFRINGPLMNFEPFYKAFNVSDKNKMYLPADKRAVIW